MARPAATRDRCQTSGNQFKCEHCGRLFSTKGNLSRHVQATHVGGQTFPCPTCGKEFKRKEDRTTHMRVHTGEKPYECCHQSCSKRFARVSDLRSHERTHNVDAKAFVCKHPGCGKRFTRPYDLKKHELNQHHRVTTVKGTPDGDPMTQVESNGNRPTKRPVAEVLEPRDGPQHSVLGRTQQGAAGLKPRPREHLGVGLSSGGVVGEHAETLSPIAQELPPPTTQARATSAHHTRHRKRVRCDAHKHCDAVATIGTGISNAAECDKGAEASDGVSHQQGENADDGLISSSVGAGGEARAHIHGASCGHVAVLHEGHVDFLMQGGQLECYDGREKTREGWVSSTNEGATDADCGCDNAPKSNGGAMATAYGDVHWDGARPDEPRGQCTGDSHGPQCGHDVIHHAGHLDYVVNGRLIHPVASLRSGGGGDGGAFEDHGSIRALDDEFVSFFVNVDSLNDNVLSENADQAVASFCDLCDREK